MSTYLRLSTRPIDQAPFATALDRLGEEELRTQVLAGGYRLLDTEADGRPGVTIVTTGAMAPEALGAAATLDYEGIQAAVIQLTSPDRVFRSWRNHGGSGHVHSLVPDGQRRWPVVSVHDASSHSLAWLGSALGAPQTALGVDRFGESGTIADLHELTGISAEHIITAAILAVS
jgi:pyruvate dehydrogenase E1 component